MLRESAMNRRGLKITALVLSGGVLLQFGGCISLAVQQMIGTIVGNAIVSLIQSVLNTGTTTT
jgi:hypothetical protein